MSSSTLTEFSTYAELLAWRKGRAEFYKRRRRERLEAARKKGSHTKEEWTALLEEFDGCCARCGWWENVQKDHVVPIYQGGSDGIENLQPLCKKCNCAKGPDDTNWVTVRRAERA